MRLVKSKSAEGRTAKFPETEADPKSMGTRLHYGNF